MKYSAKIRENLKRHNHATKRAHVVAELFDKLKEVDLILKLCLNDGTNNYTKMQII